MNYFIKSSDAEFVLQIIKFGETLPGYSGTLGISPAEVTQAQQDSEYLTWVLQCMNIYHEHSESWTKFKNLMRKGVDGNVTSVPAPPVLPGTPAVTVQPNIQERFSKLAAKCKLSPNYTATIGEDLGIEAPSVTFNPQEGKPVFTIRLVSGGKPELVWVKGRFEGVVIYRKEQGGSYSRLDTDLRPNYVDNTATAPEGQSKVYTYKMIYLYNDEQVGMWSDEVTITVTGD